MAVDTNARQKVLLLSLSGIGNYIMQSPAISKLKAAHPNWHITVWVAPRGTRALAEADPNVNAVIEMPIKASVAQHLRQIQKLRRERLDIGIVLSPGQLLKSAGYLFLAGIPRRIGGHYPLGSKSHSAFLLTDGVKEEPAIHDVDQNLKLLTPLGIQESSAPHYALHIPRDQAEAGAKLFKALEISPDRVVVGFHAGSAPDFTAKRWPVERFAQVAQRLIADANAHILLFGGPDEEDQKRDLEQQIGRPGRVNLVSAPLLTTAAVMQHCNLMLANDSGLMHLAAAVGVPTFGIFGPTDERTTGPRGLKSHVIRASDTKPVFNTELNFDLGTEPHETILAVTPDTVVATLLKHI